MVVGMWKKMQFAKYSVLVHDNININLQIAFRQGEFRKIMD